MRFFLSPAHDRPIALRVKAYVRLPPPIADSMSPETMTKIADEAERKASDAVLLRRIAEGDAEALGELYDRFSRPLYALARQILGDATEAEDIVHEVFVMLSHKAGDFEPEKGSAFTWAATLTRNRAIDRLRTRRRRGELLAQSTPLDLGYVQRGVSADPFRVKEISIEVKRAFATLPPEQRRALELAYFSGLTQQEIAEQLATPLGTIKARIRRGLLSLRAVMELRP